MIKPQNEENLSSANLKTNLAADTVAAAQTSTPKAFQLNGGNPSSLGFNVKLNMAPFNKANLDAVFKSPDKRLFPAGLGKLNQHDLADFISKIDGPMMKWLQVQQNLVLFTMSPIQALLKVAADNKIAVPQSVKDHLVNTSRMKPQQMRPVPGVKFNSIVAGLDKKRMPGK